MGRRAVFGPKGSPSAGAGTGLRRARFGYVNAVAEAGITVGCGCGNDCPNAGITNAQMAVYLVRAFGIPYMP